MGENILSKELVMKFTNHQIQVVDLMEEKSKLRFFRVKSLYIKDKDKNLKDNLKKKSQITKKE